MAVETWWSTKRRTIFVRLQGSFSKKTDSVAFLLTGWDSAANVDPSLQRIWRNGSVCQQVRLETLDGTVNILQINSIWLNNLYLSHAFSVTIYKSQNQFEFRIKIYKRENKRCLFLLTILRSFSLVYLVVCSRLSPTSPPGLRQFSHRQPWKVEMEHFRVTTMSPAVSPWNPRETNQKCWWEIPAVLHSMYTDRWHPGTPSATGFPPGTLCHRRSTPNRLCECRNVNDTGQACPLFHRYNSDTYVAHTWILLCRYPNRCNSTGDRFPHGGPTSPQCDSCCRCHGTILRMVGKQWKCTNQHCI